LGGRRGGDEDLIKRPQHLLPSDTCSQALAAFHQEPALAYNSKSEIWENDKIYSRFFSDDTSARHVVFAFSLLRAVEKKKRTLAEKQTLTQQETKQYQFLRSRGGTFLLTAAVAACLEAFLGKALPNPFRVSFGKVSPDTATTYWGSVLDATAPFCSTLQAAIDAGLKSRENVSKAIAAFQEMVEATKDANAPIFGAFSGKTIVE
jgi:hypothetical protein